MKWSLFDEENKELLKEVQKEFNLSDADLDKLKAECAVAQRKLNNLINPCSGD